MTFFLPPSTNYPIGPFGAFSWGAYWAPLPSATSGISQISTDAALSAVAVDYGTVEVRWLEPEQVATPQFTAYMIVRSTTGAPLTPTEGVVVQFGTVGSGVTNLQDSGLAQGMFYYYSYFMQLSQATPQWALAGTAVALVPTDHGMGAAMFELLPEWLQQQDETTPGHPTDSAKASWGQLRRYLELLGFQLDVLRSEADSLLLSYSPKHVREDLIPIFAAMFGFPYEAHSGGRQARRLMANWFYILKHKGTIAAIQKLAESVTGYASTVTPGKNLAVDRSSADFVGTGLGRWTHYTSPAQLTMTVDSALATSPIPGTVVAALRVTGTGVHVGFAPIYEGVGIDFTSQATRAATIPQQAIPVSASTTYTYSAYFKSNSSSRDVRLDVLYYKLDGTPASTASATATFVNGSTSAGWAQHSLTATTPSDAAFVLVEINWVNIANSEYHWMSAFQFEAGSVVTSFEPGRQADITFYPQRVNYFPNPSFESATNLYLIANNGAVTVSSSTDSAYIGTRALKIVSTNYVAPGVALTVVAANSWATSAVTGFGIVHGGIIRVPEFVAGDHWFISFFVRGGQASVGETIRARYGMYSLAGKYRAPWVDTHTLGNQSWENYAFTIAITDADIAAGVVGFVVDIEIDGAPGAATANYYIDALQIQRNGYAYQFSYFDGSSDLASWDFMWAGAANDSASMYFPNRKVRDARIRALLPDFLPVNCPFAITYALPIT